VATTSGPITVANVIELDTDAPNLCQNDTFNVQLRVTGQNATA
jgi:hypothetical protein